MSTHNIGFYKDLTKISLNYHQISSNMHLISSAVSSAKCTFFLTIGGMVKISVRLSYGYLKWLELIRAAL